jgi:NRPS condensation-like uncharacterized protein
VKQALDQNKKQNENKMNIVEDWFKAAQLIGECIDIRFGKKSPTAERPQWLGISHIECDGLGAFSKLLRESGAKNIVIPQSNYPNSKVFSPLFNAIRSQKIHPIATKNDWKIDPDESQIQEAQPDHVHSSQPISSHLFSEAETEQIVQYCRRRKVTVNSHLLKLLDQSVRPDIKRQNFTVSWLIPVNIRGSISCKIDTENQVSCLTAHVSADDTIENIQQKISHQLRQGEHRTNYLILAFSRFLPLKIKAAILSQYRKSSKGSIGGFSNLGVWDSEKSIETNDSWFFCPPVVTGQLLAAGCLTFQNRLSLTIQTHHHLPSYPHKWIDIWKRQLLQIS